MYEHSRQYVFGRMVAVAAFVAVGAAANAQSGDIPFHEEPREWFSLVAANDSDTPIVADAFVAVAADAPWIQLRFGVCDLGQESYLLLTGMQDGAAQRLDAGSLEGWRSHSALFNGEAVSIELHVAPGEAGVFATLEAIVVGEWVGDPLEPRTLCGADNRGASTDTRVGRITPVGCTAWLVSNGAYLTAGHCMGTTMTTLQFNCPASQCDGTIVNPPPEDQYPVGSAFGRDNGVGDDWCLFEALPNEDTGDRPWRRQAGFFRMTRDSTPTTVRVTGFGVDNTPAGCTGNRNAQNQTNQTHSGGFLTETVTDDIIVSISYLVDTMGGNSGSPVIVDGSDMTVGIHTHGTCNPNSNPPQGNNGTSFENNPLEANLQIFPGLNVQYADVGHTAATRDGTIFRPFATVTAAVAAAIDDGIVSVVTGGYTRAAGNTMTVGADGRSMLIEAPLGGVVIGE